MIHAPLRIDIRTPERHALLWQEQLRDRLAKLLPQSSISLVGVRNAAGWPEGVGALLWLERLLLRGSRANVCDAVDLPPTPPRANADLILDFAGDAEPGPTTRVLRPLYDGVASDQAAVAALLSGAAPTLEILDVGAGTIVAQGRISLEAADGLTGGLDAVYSRMAALIERALCSPAEVFPAEPIVVRTAPGVAAVVIRSLAFRSARAIYHLCCHSPHWRVGWRYTDGPGLFDEADGAHHGWQVMQDRNLSFAADPFPCDWNGEAGVFYERLDYRNNKGEIYYQRFEANGPSGEPVLALTEPWHLSYPFLLEHKGALFMVPEASGSGKITLYRCVEFPTRWEPVKHLVEGIEAADATIFRHEERLWMTSVVRDGVGGYSDMLAIHYASDLFAPWMEHAQRPTLVDARYARPAGSVVERNGALVRPAQDCATGYGVGVFIMRIDTLTPEKFSQTPIRRIGPGPGWPGKRLHTLNRLKRLEVIDGVTLAPKSIPMRRMANRLFEPSRSEAIAVTVPDASSPKVSTTIQAAPSPRIDE